MAALRRSHGSLIVVSPEQRERTTIVDTVCALIVVALSVILIASVGALK
jgi:hypothetical protein